MKTTTVSMRFFFGPAVYLFGVVLTSVGMAVESALFDWFHITEASQVFLFVLISLFAPEHRVIMFLSVSKACSGWTSPMRSKCR